MELHSPHAFSTRYACYCLSSRKIVCGIADRLCRGNNLSTLRNAGDGVAM